MMLALKKLLTLVLHTLLMLAIIIAVFFGFPFRVEAAQANPELSDLKTSTSKFDSIFYGEEKPFGNGTIRTFVKINQDGSPSDIGVVFTEAALLGLPQESDHIENQKVGEEFPFKLTLRDGIGFSTFEYELFFPPEASVTPFTHMALNWNPEGHGPAGIFTEAHLDFHFCMITPKERHAITVNDDFLKEAYKQIPPELNAEGYKALPLAAEPRMGLHWIDTTSSEFQKEPWTKSFIFGSYNGKVVFLEPMIPKSFLATKPNITDIIKQPATYPKPGYYPTEYSINFANGEYAVSLNKLTLR